MIAQSLTSGKPYRQIIRFAVPLFLGNLFQQFYNMADAFLVSRFLGIDAFAGVSCTGGLTNLIVGFASGMTAGLSIPLAQSYGAKEFWRVKEHYIHNLLISLATAVILTVFGLGTGDALLHILRTPADIFSYASSYVQVIFGGILVSILYNFFANTLRALGDSRSPLNYLLIASGANILLDILLIRFTSLGVRGAALATVLSQTISVILCALKIARSAQVLSLKEFRFHLSGKLICGNLRMGVPMAFQASVISLGVIFVQSATNAMGTAAIAAYHAAQKIDGVGVEPLRSLGMSMSTYTAQNYGAKKYDRILLGMRQCVLLSFLLSVLLGTVLCLGGRSLAVIFVGSGKAEILDMAHMFLCIHGVLYFILALLFDFRFALQGLGNAMIPTIAGLMELVMHAYSAFVLVPKLEFLGASIETPLSWLGALIPPLVAWLIVRRKLIQLQNKNMKEKTT